MISCPAANEIRCVKPSMATVSPSWTSSATASCIVVTLSALILRLCLFGPLSRFAQHAERVTFDATHRRTPQRGGPDAGNVERRRVGRQAHLRARFDLGDDLFE